MSCRVASRRVASCPACVHACGTCARTSGVRTGMQASVHGRAWTCMGAHWAALASGMIRGTWSVGGHFLRREDRKRRCCAIPSGAGMGMAGWHIAVRSRSMSKPGELHQVHMTAAIQRRVDGICQIWQRDETLRAPMRPKWVEVRDSGWAKSPRQQRLATHTSRARTPNKPLEPSDVHSMSRLGDCRRDLPTSHGQHPRQGPAVRFDSWS